MKKGKRRGKERQHKSRRRIEREVKGVRGGMSREGRERREERGD